MRVWVHTCLEVRDPCIMSLSLSLFVLRWSLTKPEAHPVSHRDPPISAQWYRDYSHMLPVPGFYMGSGDWTWVLLLACQALYCLNHVPSPSFSVLKEFLVENHLLIFSTLKFCFSDFLWYASKISSDTWKNLKCCFPCCLLPKPSYVILSELIITVWYV